jgi:sec-independent protein translocase protein TatA
MGLDNPLHLAFIVVILLLVFGARRLPEIGRSLGSGMREFKDSISGEAKPPALGTGAQQPQAAQPLAAQPPAAQPPVAQPPPSQQPTAPVMQPPQQQQPQQPTATPAPPPQQPPAEPVAAQPGVPAEPQQNPFGS